MRKNWPKLKKAPIIAAFFQIQFENDNKNIIKAYTEMDAFLRPLLPERENNISGQLQFSSNIPLGEAQITANTNTKIKGYTYLSEDKKTKLSLTNNSITLFEEHNYTNWEAFESIIIEILQVLEETFKDIQITRTSIRFVNQFNRPISDAPEEYFTTIIGSTCNNPILQGLVKYGFKLTTNISNNLFAVLNQNTEQNDENAIYTFDIDVISRYNYIFNIVDIKNEISQLREKKNEIFFSSLTQKNIDLCN